MVVGAWSVLGSVLVGKEGREGINLTILSGFRSTIRHLTCSTPSEIIEADQIDLAATIHLMDIMKCLNYRPAWWEVRLQWSSRFLTMGHCNKGK